MGETLDLYTYFFSVQIYFTQGALLGDTSWVDSRVHVQPPKPPRMLPKLVSICTDWVVVLAWDPLKWVTVSRYIFYISFVLSLWEWVACLLTDNLFSREMHFVLTTAGLPCPVMFVCFRIRSPSAGIIGSRGEFQGLCILPIHHQHQLQ